MFTLHGISRSCTIIVGFLMMCDVVPDNRLVRVASGWLISESLLHILIALYFRYISVDWLWIQIFGASVTFIIGIVVVAWVPESPKWLHKKGRY